MRRSLLLLWFCLLVVGGISATLFWSSFNRIVGGFGAGWDLLLLLVGIAGVAVTLLLARWGLGRTTHGQVETRKGNRVSVVDSARERSGINARPRA